MMKKYIQSIIQGLFCAGIVLQLTACNDWLDVKPRTEIESEENYETEQGYKDALTGIYLLMSSESLYGKEMTFGMVDALAQYYDGTNRSSQPYYYAKQYDYTETNNVSRINAMWSGVYNVIVNVNELIAHIDAADPSMFTGRNYHLIRGEAYGLRAFLHFDMLRLFGLSYTVGADEPAIPYVAEVTTGVYPLLSVKDVLAKVQGDLTIAEGELAIDPVVEGNDPSSRDDETYERDRTFKFNYYAVKMSQARAYLYAGNYTEANRAAQVLIGQQTFTWTPASEYSAAVANRNFVGSEELVFSLYITDLSKLYANTFTSLNGMYMTNDNYAYVYEESTYGQADFRYLYQTEMASDVRFCAKLRQPSSNGGSFTHRLPLMRISEAYYIAAECALKGGSEDVPAALGYLNQVRANRGLYAELSSTFTADDAQTELDKEVRKEFFCEGQLYFYYKRLNRESIPASYSYGWLSTVSPKYVFPLPDDELEFGGRVQND